MSAVWSLPGYEVEVLLGSGATGEVWQARELVTGDRVALKRLYEPLESGTREALTDTARLLRDVDSPYLVRLRCVVEDVLVLDLARGGSLASLVARRGRLGPGEVVTVGAPLASALGAAHDRGLVHGGLSATSVLFSEEGMPMLAGVGLAPLRGEDRSPSSPAAGEDEPPSAAGDVRALASVCDSLLVPEGADAADGVAAGVRAPLPAAAPGAPALVAAVAAVLAAAAEQRPDAVTFGAMLRSACPAVPVGLTGGVAPVGPGPASGTGQRGPSARPLGQPPVQERPARSWGGQQVAPRAQERERRPAQGARPPLRPGHRTARRRPRPAPPGSRRTGVPGGAVVAVGIVLLVLGAAAVGWLSARGEVLVAAAVPPLAEPTAVSAEPVPSVAPTPAVQPETPDWPTVLDQLDAARARAFASADTQALADVWAPGSPGLAADTRALQQLAGAGQTAQGVRHDIRDVRAPAGPGPALTGAAVQLEVVDVLEAQEIRDATGEVVRRLAAREPAGWLLELVRTAAGWRLVSVSPAR